MIYAHRMQAFVLVSAVLLTATGLAHAADKQIKIDGSSTVYPITEAVAEEFQKNKKGAVKVTVGVSGTGGGFKKFCRDEIDIASASRPILKSEIDICKAAGIGFIEMPVAYDALTVIVNPKNDWLNSITVAELKKIWEPAAQGKIMTWKQVNPAWPDTPLKLYGAGADSGTFDYFTEAIVGKSKSSRGDFTASENDNVLVTGVANDKNALGYFGFSYYIENQKKLKAVAIIADKDTGKVKGGANAAILPSEKTVEDGSYQPLSRPVFIYVNAKSANKAEIKEFVEFYMSKGPALVKEVKYIPLPAKAYALNIQHFNQKKLGTVFDGNAAVGVKIEDLMKREAK